jgi:pimeloyl-ACP methyl ester carboxylesterase
MGKGWKILVGVILVVGALLALNTITIDNETEAAAVTEPGGKILDLAGGEMQVVDRGPRNASPIVLIHCFSCAINYWNRMVPLLDGDHRVIAVDLLGHGGSEKPTSGYTVPHQADLITEALVKLGVRNAIVVGHSLGGTIAVALAERSPQLVKKVMIIDTPPDLSGGSLGLIAKLGFEPVIGEFFWRVKPDFAVRKGLGVAFAPGFDVPDEFVEDVNRMTYSPYHDSVQSSGDYLEEEPLDQRMAESGKSLLVIMGAEEQIIDEPARRLAEYRHTVPGAKTKLVSGAGHSPNVEKPAETAALLLAFAKAAEEGVPSRHATPAPRSGSAGDSGSAGAKQR